MSDTGEQFRRVYNRRFPHDSRHAKAAMWRVLVESYFQKWIGRDDVVLDLGCGFGEFLNYLRSGRKIGVDMNPAGADHVANDVEFHAADVCDLSFLGDSTIDCIFTSNLMEHLPDKSAVQQMLRESGRVLKPGGQLIALGPNLRYLPGRYWDFWDHLVPITDHSLAEALELEDFVVVKRIAKFLPYSTCSPLPQGTALVRWYLRLPMFWHIFGKQFLIRARRIKG